VDYLLQKTAFFIRISAKKQLFSAIFRPKSSFFFRFFRYFFRYDNIIASCIIAS